MMNFPKNIEVIQSFPGHILTVGKNAKQELNNYWLVNDINDKNNIFYIMSCKNNVFVYLSVNSINHILINPSNNKYYTWHQLNCGFIGSYNKGKIIYLHKIISKIIFNLENNNKITNHIDKNKCNNRIENLELIESYIIKKKRKCNAKPLPNGILEKDIPKYVVYCKECINAKTNTFREYFKIEKHPKLPKSWATCKSNKVNIQNKLQSCINKINELNAFVM
jgi:hypothetical protein